MHRVFFMVWLLLTACSTPPAVNIPPQALFVQQAEQAFQTHNYPQAVYLYQQALPDYLRLLQLDDVIAIQLRLCEAHARLKAPEALKAAIDQTQTTLNLLEPEPVQHKAQSDAQHYLDYLKARHALLSDDDTALDQFIALAQRLSADDPLYAGSLLYQYEIRQPAISADDALVDQIHQIIMQQPQRIQLRWQRLQALHAGSIKQLLTVLNQYQAIGYTPGMAVTLTNLAQISQGQRAQAYQAYANALYRSMGLSIPDPVGTLEQTADPHQL